MRRGFTLVEVVASLAVLGLASGIAVVSLGALRAPPTLGVVRSLEAARAEAVGTGRAVTWRSGAAVVRFLPDGSSSGGTFQADSLRIDVEPLTGVVHAAR